MFDDILPGLRDPKATTSSREESRSTAVPADLSEDVEVWLRRSLSLADAFSQDHAASRLRTLDARRRTPGFRLAFVGEFNRGKSTLINRLLARDVLPLGVLPTTATLTLISAGSEERMEVTHPDGRQEIRPIEETSWKDLLLGDPTVERQSLPKVRLNLDDPWLHAHDVELVDTPGAGDLSEHRTAVVFDLLGQCDGAVLLVSATSGFSMTEAAFLEQEVVGHHVPLVLVVVSHLDSDALPREQRKNVLAVIRDKVSDVSTQIPVLPSHPVDEVEANAALQAVKGQIEAMVAAGDRRAWRSRQVAAQIADQLTYLVEVGEASVVAARMDAEERRQEQRRRRDERAKAELRWEGIRMELAQRRLRRDNEMRERIMSTKAQVIETLSEELNDAPDPQAWWKQYLPRRMHSKLVGVASRSEAFLMENLADDFDWLQDEVSRTFETRIARDATGFPERLELDPKLGRLELADNQRFRLFARLGSGAGMIGSFVLLSPIGLAASVAAYVGAEMLINQKVEQQRETILRELERGVDRAYREYCEGIAERMRQLYRRMEEIVSSKQEDMQALQSATAKTVGVGERAEDWQRLVTEASAQKEEILAALSRQQTAAT